MNMKKSSQPGLSEGFDNSCETDPHVPGTEVAEDLQPAVEVAAEAVSLPRQDQQIMDAIRNAMVLEGKLQEGRIFLNSHGESHVEVMKHIPNQKPASYGVYKLV